MLEEDFSRDLVTTAGLLLCVLEMVSFYGCMVQLVSEPRLL